MPITPSELSRRIQAARAACGLTQEQVAVHLGVSRSVVAQMERGKRSVSSLELDRLARLLGRDIREFVAESFHGEDALAALFRAEAAGVGQPAVVAALRDCVALGREIRNVEALLGIQRAAGAPALYPVPAPSTRWEAIEQGGRLAREERRRLGLGDAALPDLAELLEMQGVRAGVVDLPDDVSGLTLNDPQHGLFVIANREHHLLRRRFSFAHEYAHVLADRSRLGVISRVSERRNLLEIRANAFAAAFLMPAEGVREFIAALGKGKPSRSSSDVFDETASVTAEARTLPGSQALQLYDVVQIAHHFGVSRIATLFRLLNLRLLKDPEFRYLRGLDEEGRGRELAVALGLPEPDQDEARNWFHHRFLGLALEAYRREDISRGKLEELCAMLGLDREQVDLLLMEAGLGEQASEKPPDR